LRARNGGGGEKCRYVKKGQIGSEKKGIKRDNKTLGKPDGGVVKNYLIGKEAEVGP